MHSYEVAFNIMVGFMLKHKAHHNGSKSTKAKVQMSV